LGAEEDELLLLELLDRKVSAATAFDVSMARAVASDSAMKAASAAAVLSAFAFCSREIGRAHV
jgi:hypothetical protein